jgi:SAM-dependent methyltransferase
MSGWFSCHACGGRASGLAAPALKFLAGSDCTPAAGQVELGVCRACGLLQKNNTREWQSLCKKIYGSYRVYHQAAGQEQKARGITGGRLAPRSELIANFLREAGKLPQSASILDIGCGNGPFLRAINNLLPDWRITGSDINESFRKDILALSPRAAFQNESELKDNAEKFDVVSLIHCIEHISAPVAYLADARRHLKPSGLLLIEVPDAAVNPFDLVVADHASHFSKATLARVIEAAGFRLLACGNLVLGKEITALASPLPRAAVAPPCSNINEAEMARRNISWLKQTMHQGRTLANSSKPFGIFGTSIAGVWIGTALGNSVDFFVDEDENRIGRDYFGAPILAPSGVPTGATVFVCLEPKLAEAIAARHSDTSRRYIAPPPLNAV